MEQWSAVPESAGRLASIPHLRVAWSCYGPDQLMDAWIPRVALTQFLSETRKDVTRLASILTHMFVPSADFIPIAATALELDK